MAPKSSEALPDVTKLRISDQKSTSKASKQTKAEPVADSWEDDISGSDDATTKSSRPPKKSSTVTDDDQGRLRPPSPPPPTSADPAVSSKSDNLSSLHPSYAASSRAPISPRTRTPLSGGRDADLSVRPDKSTAAARRLIAGALGVKVGRQTEEEREYERVVRERERKRREEARAREKAEAAAREERVRSVWED